MASNNVCDTCKVAFRGRNPQIVACCECKLVVHVQVDRYDASYLSTWKPHQYRYVRMKKYKEAFEFKCVKCFARHHGCTSPSVVTRKRKATKPTEPSSKRNVKSQNQLMLMNVLMVARLSEQQVNVNERSGGRKTIGAAS